MKKNTTFGGLTVSLAVIVTLAAAIGFTACSGKNTKASAGRKPTLRVQTTDTFKPWGFANDKGEADGFNVELFKIIVGNYLKDDYNFIYESVPIDVLNSNLESGKSDVIAFEIERIPEFEQKITFSNVAKSTLVPRIIVLKKDASKYRSWDDFRGKTIYVIPGADAASLERYNESNKSNPIKLEYISDPATCVQALVDGRADAFVRGGFAAISFGETYGVELKPVGDPVRNVETYFVFRKNIDANLVQKVDKAVTELIADGTVSALHKKWYNGYDYTPPYDFDPASE